jgi:predicted dithiol-disulfide oxidoreductase (DUF899 family)
MTGSEHAVVEHEDWVAARTALLVKEKEFTRLRDELSRERRTLPWERVDKEFVFVGPDGSQTLAELFDGSDFNYDFGVSFRPDKHEAPVYNFGTLAPGRADREGVSVFFKDATGQIFRTYSSYARGIDMLNTTYHYLDVVPNGRGEEGNSPQYWVRRHDEYER